MGAFFISLPLAYNLYPIAPKGASYSASGASYILIQIISVMAKACL